MIRNGFPLIAAPGSVCRMFPMFLCCGRLLITRTRFAVYFDNCPGSHSFLRATLPFFIHISLAVREFLLSAWNVQFIIIANPLQFSVIFKNRVETREKGKLWWNSSLLRFLSSFFPKLFKRIILQFTGSSSFYACINWTGTTVERWLTKEMH